MPNYGTVETSKDLAPMSTGQKYAWPPLEFLTIHFPFIATLAASRPGQQFPEVLGKARALWPALRRFVRGQWHRTYMTTAIFPVDYFMRIRVYYQMAKGSFSHRSFHAIERLFITRNRFRKRPF